MKSTEELLTTIMNQLAEKYKGKLILKGGMLLRLYKSPRSTQDVDYVLLSEESKKKLVGPFQKIISDIEGLTITKTNLNSRGIIIEVQDDAEHVALVEINVLPALRLPAEPLSTIDLAAPYGLSARVVATMALPEAFANKIAAALERDAVRDIYDLSIMEPIGNFDEATLRQRFSQLSIGRRKPVAVSLGKAAEMLRSRLDQLDEKKLRVELYPLIPEEYQVGLPLLIRASVGRVIQRMESLEPPKT